MAIARGGGSTGGRRSRAMPRGAGGRIEHPIHRPDIAAPAGVQRLQGLVRRRGQGGAPDVQAEMAALEEQLAGARPAGGGGLDALGQAFQASRVQGGSDPRRQMLEKLLRRPGQDSRDRSQGGIEALLEALGQAGL